MLSCRDFVNNADQLLNRDLRVSTRISLQIHLLLCNGLYSFPQQPVIPATKAPCSGKRNTNAACSRNKFLLTASVRQIADNICCVFPHRENVAGADAAGNHILLTVKEMSSKPVMRCNKKHPTASHCGHLTLTKQGTDYETTNKKHLQINHWYGLYFHQPDTPHGQYGRQSLRCNRSRQWLSARR